MFCRDIHRRASLNSSTCNVTINFFFSKCITSLLFVVKSNFVRRLIADYKCNVKLHNTEVQYMLKFDEYSRERNPVCLCYIGAHRREGFFYPCSDPPNLALDRRYLQSLYKAYWLLSARNSIRRQRLTVVPLPGQLLQRICRHLHPVVTKTFPLTTVRGGHE